MTISFQTADNILACDLGNATRNRLVSVHLLVASV